MYGVTNSSGMKWYKKDPPFGRPSFEQTTYNIQVAKTPWQYLGRKSHCWKAHFFKICFFVKYFRQRLLSLVNMGLHAAIIRLSPLIHEGEQRYKPYIVWWVASVTPPLKNPGYTPGPYSRYSPSLHALEDWRDKSNVTWILRGQTSDKNRPMHKIRQ